jgi:hypothetical protein
MTTRKHDEPLDEPANDSGEAESESGAQAGDSQGLPQSTEEASVSVEELAESGQAYEAELLEGVEEAADHPERPVHTREDQSRTPELPPVRKSD